MLFQSLLTKDVSPICRERAAPDHHPGGDRRRHPDRVRHPRRRHVPQESQDDGLLRRYARQVNLLDLGLGEGCLLLQHRRDVDRRHVLLVQSGQKGE